MSPPAIQLPLAAAPASAPVATGDAAASEANAAAFDQQLQAARAAPAATSGTPTASAPGTTPTSDATAATGTEVAMTTPATPTPPRLLATPPALRERGDAPLADTDLAALMQAASAPPSEKPTGTPPATATKTDPADSPDDEAAAALAGALLALLGQASASGTPTWAGATPSPGRPVALDAAASPLPAGMTAVNLTATDITLPSALPAGAVTTTGGAAGKTVAPAPQAAADVVANDAAAAALLPRLHATHPMPFEVPGQPLPARFAWAPDLTMTAGAAPTEQAAPGATVTLAGSAAANAPGPATPGIVPPAMAAAITLDLAPLTTAHAGDSGMPAARAATVTALGAGISPAIATLLHDTGAASPPAVAPAAVTPAAFILPQAAGGVGKPPLMGSEDALDDGASDNAIDLGEASNAGTTRAGTSATTASTFAAALPGASPASAPVLGVNGLPMAATARKEHALDALAPLLASPTTANAPTSLPTLQVTVPPNNPGFANELGQQVVWLGQQNIQQASIRLHPDELGAIDVQLKLHHDRVDVTFAVQHPAAAAAVQQSLPQLNQLLAQHGLALGHAEVGQQQHGDGGQPRQHQSGSAAPEAEPGELGAVGAARPVQLRNGGLDAFA